MLHQASQYIKFLLRSTNQHGVHSPFVYDLVTKCFYDKTEYEAYSPILNYRKNLLKSKTKIRVTDLGAGSKVMKPQERHVSKIAKNAGTTYNRAKLLYRTINYFKPKTILELGTSLGIASQAMSLGFTKTNIITVEGCPNTANFSKESFNTLGLDNVNVIANNFDEATKDLSKHKYDFIFFDGNHQKDPTLQYFESLLKTTDNDSVFIFDDIYWSKGMTEAWETIKQHPKVTVTIDTFFWGFVFFRKEQAKQHFTIRI